MGRKIICLYSALINSKNVNFGDHDTQKEIKFIIKTKSIQTYNVYFTIESIVKKKVIFTELNENLERTTI